ncbi:hypothetical protein RCL1_007005 [Eukaryota sp. TZLM3-RCL]
MGVKSFWSLVEPFCSTAPLSTFSDSIFIIDFSVWLVQLETTQSSSEDIIYSIFSRLVKLLHHNIQPIIVYDGPTHRLKVETLRERRQRRELSLFKIEKEAHKVLHSSIQDHAFSAVQNQSKMMGDDVDDQSKVVEEPEELLSPTHFKNVNYNHFDFEDCQSFVEPVSTSLSCQSSIIDESLVISRDDVTDCLFSPLSPLSHHFSCPSVLSCSSTIGSKVVETPVSEVLCQEERDQSFDLDSELITTEEIIVDKSLTHDQSFLTVDDDLIAYDDVIDDLIPPIKKKKIEESDICESFDDKFENSVPLTTKPFQIDVDKIKDSDHTFEIFDEIFQLSSSSEPSSPVIKPPVLVQPTLDKWLTSTKKSSDHDTPRHQSFILSQLFQLLSIPTVNSKSDAEAQCANFFNQIGLDWSRLHVLTEDSDAFLFGAKKVVRVDFTTETVRCYEMELILQNLRLQFSEFLLFPLLVSSDYSLGLGNCAKTVGLLLFAVLKIVKRHRNLQTTLIFDDLYLLIELITKDSELQCLEFTQSLSRHQSRVVKEFNQRRRRLIIPKNFPSIQVFNLFKNPDIDNILLSDLKFNQINYNEVEVFICKCFSIKKDAALKLFDKLVTKATPADQQFDCSQFLIVSKLMKDILTTLGDFQE